MRLKIIIGLIVALEVGTIAWLGFGIYEKKVGAAAVLLSVAPLHKDDFVQNGGSSLEYFYEPKPDSEASNIQPSWLAHQPTYRINSDTLRDSVDHDAAKPAGTVRIALLGDSFTYGLYVDEAATYGKQLERLLSASCPATHFEVLNLGVPGYDLTYAAERFKVRGAKYDPDVVVWLIKRDDMMDDMEFVTPRVDAKLAGTERTNDEMRTAWDEVIDEERKAITPADLFALHAHALQTVRDSFNGTLVLYAPMTLVYQDPIGYLQELRTFGVNDPRTLRYFSPITFPDGTLFPDGHPRPAADAQIAQDLFAYFKDHHLAPCT